MTTTDDRPAVTIAPCPDWCVLPAGHEYDDDLQRWHEAFSGTGVGVDAIETYHEGVVTLGEPVAILDVDADLAAPAHVLRRSPPS